MQSILPVKLVNEVPITGLSTFDRDSLPEKARQVSVAKPGPSVEVWNQAISLFSDKVNLVLLVGTPESGGHVEGWSVPADVLDSVTAAQF